MKGDGVCEYNNPKNCYTAIILGHSTVKKKVNSLTYFSFTDIDLEPYCETH